jgi:hypothetical protein
MTSAESELILMCFHYRSTNRSMALHLHEVFSPNSYGLRARYKKESSK